MGKNQFCDSYRTWQIWAVFKYPFAPIRLEPRPGGFPHTKVTLPNLHCTMKVNTSKNVDECQSSSTKKLESLVHKQKVFF